MLKSLVSWVAVGSLSLLVVGCGDSGSGAGGEGGGADGGADGEGGTTTEGGGGEGTGGEGAGVGDGDYTISPPYEPAPETIEDPDVPKGTVGYFDMSSTESEIFPTDFGTGETFSRSVGVYVPAQYEPGTAAPFMVVQDGLAFYAVTMATVLDNMIAAKKLPPMIAIFVEPGPDSGIPDGERSFEYDSLSDRYLTFVETELLPRVESELGVTLTTDPEGRGSMGGSSGGAAAFTMGWFGTDLYRRILTYSGSFCDLQPNAEYPHGAWSYHESLIAESDPKPLRVALAVGGNDLDWNTPEDQMRAWIPANEGMAAALKAKGYHYRYVFAEDSEHVDDAVMQQTLPETLAWLWQDYPVE